MGAIGLLVRLHLSFACAIRGTPPPVIRTHQGVRLHLSFARGRIRGRVRIGDMVGINRVGVTVTCRGNNRVRGTIPGDRGHESMRRAPLEAVVRVHRVTSISPQMQGGTWYRPVLWVVMPCLEP